MSQPAVRKEVIDLGSFGRRKPGQHILHVFKGIDVKALAGLDDTHDRGGSVTTFFGAGKQPVAPTEHHRLDATFTGIIADFNERMVKVNQKSGPAIESVRDGISKFGFWQFNELLFVEPGFEQIEFRLCQPFGASLCVQLRTSVVASRSMSKRLLMTPMGNSAATRVMLPGIFKVAMHVRPAVGGGSTVLNNLIELIGAIRLKDAGIACKNSFRIDRVLGVRIIVEDVGIISVATVDPDESPVCFAEPFFNNRKSGGIRLNNTTFQNELPHSFDNWGKRSATPFSHRHMEDRLIGNAQGCEHLLLAVKRQVQPEFIGCNFGKKSRTGQAFINWLVGLLSSDYLPVTIFAGVFEHDVLDAFEESRTNSIW